MGETLLLKELMEINEVIHGTPATPLSPFLTALLRSPTSHSFNRNLPAAHPVPATEGATTVNPEKRGTAPGAPLSLGEGYSNPEVSLSCQLSPEAVTVAQLTHHLGSSQQLFRFVPGINSLNLHPSCPVWL